DPYDGRVVISFIRQALNNEPITVFGEGKQTRSLCYVTDLVRGINLVMESDFHEPINLGNPEEVTILQIAREILALLPASTSQIVHQPMPPDDPRVRCPDITRAKQILGWQPVVPRKEGLAKMIEHYLDELVNELGKGNRLEFRDFGVFETKLRKARKAQNPKTLEPVEVPEKRTVKFKVGRLMKQRLASLTGAAIDDEAADVADMAEHSAEEDENGG